MHWILFGSSGHTTRPSKGVLRSYYKCLPLMHSQHTLIKTIANTRWAGGPVKGELLLQRDKGAGWG